MLIAFFARIYEPLNLQRPFQKSEVRDSECLVYYRGFPNGSPLFVYLRPLTRGHRALTPFGADVRTKKRQPSAVSMYVHR